MTELSNAVTVLIARMESHPEDFNTNGFGNPKFHDVADALYGLAGLDKERAASYWFLTDADKEALIEAWKKYHRTAMEKGVMEKIFDDGSDERDRKAAYHASRQKSLSQMTAIHPLQNSAQNAVLQGGNYNGGLLGQAGSMFGSWVGGSK